jgi:coatomer subunit beta'
LRQLAERAEELTRINIAFSSYFLLVFIIFKKKLYEPSKYPSANKADLDKCIDVLVNCNRIPEAALFAKTYCPSKIPAIVIKWKEYLQKENPVTGKYHLYIKGFSSHYFPFSPKDCRSF